MGSTTGGAGLVAAQVSDRRRQAMNDDTRDEWWQGIRVRPLESLPSLSLTQVGNEWRRMEKIDDERAKISDERLRKATIEGRAMTARSGCPPVDSN
ncbi:hypothetical protein U1Q18_010089 [Sarracenia purpurea var. burkii]